MAIGEKISRELIITCYAISGLQHVALWLWKNWEAGASLTPKTPQKNYSWQLCYPFVQRYPGQQILSKSTQPKCIGSVVIKTRVRTWRGMILQMFLGYTIVVLFYHSERRACMTPKFFYKYLCSHRHLKKIRHNKIISGVNKGKRNIKEAIEQIVSKTHINDS